VSPGCLQAVTLGSTGMLQGCYSGCYGVLRIGVILGMLPGCYRGGAWGSSRLIPGFYRGVPSEFTAV